MNINLEDDKSFKGVFFLNTQDYAVVCTQWIVKSNNKFKCYWPNYGDPVTMAKNKTPRESTWPTYSCRLITSGSEYEAFIF